MKIWWKPDEHSQAGEKTEMQKSGETCVKFVEKAFYMLKYHQKQRFHSMLWWNSNRFCGEIEDINLVKTWWNLKKCCTVRSPLKIWWNFQGLVNSGETWIIGEDLVEFPSLGEIRAIFSISGIFWYLVETWWKPNEFAKSGESLVKFPQPWWTWQKNDRNVLLFWAFVKNVCCNQDRKLFSQNAS